MQPTDPSPITVSRRATPFRPRFFFGLVLIFLGVVFSFDQMGWIDAGDILQYFWPAVLIAAGASKLLWPASPTSRLTGLLLLAVGVWLLLEHLDLIDASVWDYWPLLLVFLGVRIVLRGLGGETHRAAPSDNASTVNAMAVMGGVSRTSNSPDFRGGDMFAFMGGVEIDLRQARIIGGSAVIDAFAFWGGVEIRVPEDWSVVVRGVPLLGGYEDKTRPPAVDPTEPRQELIVKGFAIMGGVEIKN